MANVFDQFDDTVVGEAPEANPFDQFDEPQAAPSPVEQITGPHSYTDPLYHRNNTPPASEPRAPLGVTSAPEPQPSPVDDAAPEPFEPAPERGLLGDVASNIGRGIADTGELAGQTLKTLGADKLGQYIVDKSVKAQQSEFLTPDESEARGESFGKRGIMGGLRSAMPSFASMGLGAATGAAVGSVVPVIGTTLGALAGIGVSTGGLFGLGIYGKEKDAAIAKGLTEDEAHDYALGQALVEGGIEAATSPLEAFLAFGTGGGTKVGTQTIKQLLKTSTKELLGRYLKTMGVETGTEMVQSGLGNYLAQQHGMAEGPTDEAIVESIIPAITMSLMFATGGQAYNSMERRRMGKVLADPNADQKSRLDAANKIYARLRAKDEMVAGHWALYATDAIENGEAIDLEMDVIDFAAARMAEEDAPQERPGLVERAATTGAYTGAQVATVGQEEAVVMQGGRRAAMMGTVTDPQIIDRPVEDAEWDIQAEESDKYRKRRNEVPPPAIPPKQMTEDELAYQSYEPELPPRIAEEIEVERQAAQPSPPRQTGNVVEEKGSVVRGQEFEPNPTEAQKEAGNYKKPTARLDGMEITVENPVGSTRKGTDKTGKKWAVTMNNDYGYIKGTVGRDKDHLDVFIKPGYKGGAPYVYVVNQYVDGKFDEHKIVLGASSEKEAMNLYRSNYEHGWKGGKSITRMPMAAFKVWSKSNAPKNGALERSRTVTLGEDIDPRYALPAGYESGKAPIVNRKTIAKALVGAKVSRVNPKEAGVDQGEAYRVEMPNGSVMLINPARNEIRIVDQAKAEEQWRGVVGSENQARDKAYGSFQFDGKKGLISLVSDPGELSTLDHEIYHAAERMVLTDKEIEVLARRFGNEEARAVAYQRYRDAKFDYSPRIKRLFDKIYDFVLRLTHAVRPTAASTIREIESGRVWKGREQRTSKKAEPAYSAAFHGSPHRFKKFDISKIGTGEGAQAYGSGLYFSSIRDVAEFYAEKLTDGSRGGFSISGEMPSSPDEGLSYNTWSAAKNLSELLVSDTGVIKSFSSLGIVEQRRVLSVMKTILEDNKILDSVVGLVPVDVVNMLGGTKYSSQYLLDNPTMLVYLLPVNTNNLVPSSAKAIDILAPAMTIVAAKVHTGLARFDISPSDFFTAGGAVHKVPPRNVLSKIPYPNEFRKGQLYKVELAPAEDQYLLWDRPLSEQSEKVKAALANENFSDRIEETTSDLENFDTVPTGRFAKVMRTGSGQDIYSFLSEKLGKEREMTGGWTANISDEKAASDHLHSLGIRGIKYLDGSSRRKGEGAYNYVIFDDADVEITDTFYSIMPPSRHPKKTVTAYKLFKTYKKQPGKIFPIFIDNKTPTEVGVWLEAERHPTKGFGDYPGWHAGELPKAPHLMKKDGTLPTDRVWAEVEMAADVDYQKEADTAKGIKKLKSKIPEGGYYRFQTSKLQGGAWIISGALKVKRILTNEEAQQIAEASDTNPDIRYSVSPARARRAFNRKYSGEAWDRKLERFGAGALSLGDIAEPPHYALDKLRWDVDTNVDVFGTVNNRLGNELQMFERVFGRSDKAVMAPGVLVKGKRLPARTIKPHDMGLEVERVIKSGEYQKLMDDPRSNKEIAASRKDLDKQDRARLVEDLNVLRGKSNILGDNSKAGRGIDFILGTCQPTENCQVCYAARSFFRMSHVRKSMRNTFRILTDPKGFAEDVAKEVKKIPINEMPFLRLLGSGDLTSSEQVESFNHMAQLLDRPIQIFSRHHENLAKLKSTKSAPFIKMGSVDNALVQEYGIAKLGKNLQNRGIANAVLYMDESELPHIQKLAKKNAIGLILSASPELHLTLPIELQRLSCPCDAHERTHHGSCRQCMLSMSGCFTCFADKGVGLDGKIISMGEPGSQLAFPIINLANNKKFNIDQSYLKTFNFIIDSSITTIKNHIRALNAQKTNGAGAKRSSILLRDLRFPDSVVMLIDEGNPLGVKPNPEYTVIESPDPVADAEAYIGELEAQKLRAEKGTFYLPGGQIQPPKAWSDWQRLAAPELISKEDAQAGRYSLAPGAARFKPVDTTSPEFKRWFGKSKVVDKNGKPLVVYHGTTHDFPAFNKNRANIENDMGAGFYFSNNPDDISSNYAGEGPDLTQRIELLAERYVNNIQDDPEGFGLDDAATEKEVEKRAKELARKELSGGASNAIPAYLSFQNPVFLGGRNETILEMTSDRPQDEVAGYADEAWDEIKDEDDLADDERDNYAEEIRERAEQKYDEYYGDVVESGSLVDFVEGLRQAASRYDEVDIEEAISGLLERASYDSITATEAIEFLKKNEGLAYASDYDNDTGLASSEIIRDAFERAGFDGVIDGTVDVKFGSQRRIGQPMEGMDYNTVHYIAFFPTQIKSAISNIGEFSDANPDIRFSITAPPSPVTYSKELEAFRAKVISRMKNIEARKTYVEPDAGKQILNTLKTAAGNLSPAQIAKKMQGYEQVLAKLKDDKADLTVKIKALEDFLVRNADKEVRGHAHLQTIYPQLAAAKTEVARLKLLDRAIGRLDQLNSEYLRRESLSDMRKQIKLNKPKLKGQIKTQTSGGYHLYRELMEIRRILRESDDQIEKEINELHEALDRGELYTDSEQKELDALIEKKVEKGLTEGETARLRSLIANGNEAKLRRLATYGLLSRRPGVEAAHAAKELRNMIVSAKMDWIDEMIVLREKRVRQRAEATTEITGGKGLMGEEEENLQRDKNRGFLSQFMEGVRSYDDKHQSWEWMLDKLARYSKKGVLESDLVKRFGKMVNLATRNEQAGLTDSFALLQEKMAQIWGVDPKKLESARRKDSGIQENTGVYKYLQDGTKMFETAVPMSQNQAYKRWMEWQDTSLRDSLMSQGYTERSIEEIEKFMTPEIRAWAEWQLNEFYPQYHPGVNSVFREMFYTDMPFNNRYSPIKRRYDKGEVDDNLLKQNTPWSSIVAGSIKQRVDNNREILLQDGDSVLSHHISQMEHFKAWAATMRELRSVLGSEQVRTAIKQYHGSTALNVMNNFMDDFARGKAHERYRSEWVQFFRRNFTTAAVGANPVVFVKQLTSVPAYAMDMPTTEWLKGLAWMNTPGKVRKAYRTLMKSEVMKARYKIGFERDMILAMGSMRKTTGARNWADRLMILTKLGDRFAIVYGGWPVYQYHHQQAIKAGKSEEEAHDIAIEKFEDATMRSQQAGELKDLNQFQRGGAFAQLFTMFYTAPSAYYRSWIGGIRGLQGMSGEDWQKLLTLRGDPKHYKAAKRVFVGQVVLPAIFMMATNGFEWDDDDMLSAVLLGPLSGMFMLRDLGLGVYNIAVGENNYADPGLPPMFSTVGEAGKAIAKGRRHAADFSQMTLDEWLTDPEFWETVQSAGTAIGNVTGMPFGPVSRTAEGVYASVKSGKTVAPIRRSVGWSENRLDSTRREYGDIMKGINRRGKADQAWTMSRNYHKVVTRYNKMIREGKNLSRADQIDLHQRRAEIMQQFIESYKNL